MEGKFTDGELRLAKSVDLCLVAEALGYTVKRVGRYHTIKEMDSIRIYDRTNWYRWSRQGERGSNGGSQIDFLKVFAGMGIKEAVFWLLDFAGYKRIDTAGERKGLTNRRIVSEKERQPERKPFLLPTKAPDNMQITEYLTKKRGISKATVQRFIDSGLVYESKQYHNVVFIGTDAEGTARFASMRGTYDKNGKAFKCDVAGNDKRYGFHVANDGAGTVAVFEAAIDLMSYADIFHDTGEHLLALGMVADHPLEQYLKDHPEIRCIRFCLDNDEPGRKASFELAEKYMRYGYAVKIDGAPEEYKDYNEWLVGMKMKNGIRIGSKPDNGIGLRHR